MSDLGILILLIIATEAVTEIVVASDFPLFLWFRTRLSQRAIPETPRDDFRQHAIVSVHKLFTCGYCFSVWVAAFFSFFAPSFFDDKFVNWMCFTFVLHRTSNWVHVVFELIKRGRIGTHDLNHVIKIIIADEDDKNDKDDETDDLIDALEEE